ncbi:MAG: SLC13 family permease [Halanaerobiales bacterium]|nr:SLC13 family permease [Halanaerobiales bacterium]
MDKRLIFLALILCLVLLTPTINAQEQSLNDIPKVSIDMNIIVTLSIIVLLMVLFFFEPINIDIIALAVPVILIILNRWTKVTPEEAISGFANQATITVLAMFILSAGIQQTGILQVLGRKIADITGSNHYRQVGFITGITGVIAGIINNTAVVATLIPMVNDIAGKTKTSPSKLLIPLSYAAMLGGMITLVGTSTNLLASDISARLIGHPFSMFEFTKLGFLVLVIGIIYLIVIGHRLLPNRIKVSEDLFEEYEMRDYLTEVVIEKNSLLIDKTLDEFKKSTGMDLDIVLMSRKDSQYIDPSFRKRLKKGDHLIIRADHQTILKVMKRNGLRLVPHSNIYEKNLKDPMKGQKLMEVVIPYGSFMQGQTISQVNFLERYETAVLAIRRGGGLTHKRMQDIKLMAGDVILLLVNEETADRFRKNENFIIAREIDTRNYEFTKALKAISILIGVVFLAAIDVVPIVISALGGVIAMVATKTIDHSKLYSSINWEVIFLLAGLIPLGIAVEKTGTAQYISFQVLKLSNYFSPVMMLVIFYFLTAFLTNIISKNASVILMIPIAVDAAQTLNLNPFAFVLAVTFAAGTAFMTPIGNQTNLMVYGPGGYKFKDYVITGFPLQIVLGIVTTLSIVYIWGL